MKREFLKALGVTDENINKIMSENGVDIEVEKAKTTTAITERDGYKLSLDETQIELKKFEGLDIEAQKKSIVDMQTKYDTDTKALNDKITRQDYMNGAEKYLRDVPFSSEFARKQVLSEFEKQEFKQDGEKFLGADDWIKNMQTSSPDAFKVVADEEKVDVGTNMTKTKNQEPVADMSSALTDYYKK